MILRKLLFILIFNISLLACGSGWSYYDKQFMFLENREEVFSNYSGNLKDPNTYNHIYRNYKKRNKQQNLLEWKEQLDSSLTLEQIEQIVYKRKDLSLVKDQEILEYLNFISKQENHVIADYYYYGKEKKKINEQILINEAVSKIASVKSKYLKLRYFYLALRLAHFKNKNALALYEKFNHLLENENKTIVKDWITGLYAGALIKNKQIALGVYEFTKLFDKSKINWHLSFYNFNHINTNELWNELQSFAKTQDEKLKFITLRALNSNANTLMELDNIYKVDKNSKWFDYILYRQLLHSQHFFDEADYYERDFQIKENIKYLETIQKDDMYTVNLSLAYYYLYDKQLEKAKALSNKLLTINNNHETKTLNYVIYLNSLETVDLKEENIIYEKMNELISEHKDENNYIHNYTFLKLKKLYKNQKDYFKALLSKNMRFIDSSSFNLESINKFKEFIKSDANSKLEEFFQNSYKKRGHIRFKNNKITLSTKLKKAQVKILLNNLMFEEALKIDSKYLDEKIQFNPFNVNIRGNNRKGKQNTYTIREFLNKAIIIKKELDKNPKSVMDNYLYANAIYNLSYFGNSNDITTVYRSNYAFKEKQLETNKVNLSIKYYKETLKHSNKKEFKSKVTYMLAKSELALYDIKYAKKVGTYYGMANGAYESDRLWKYSKHDTYIKYIKNGYGEFFNKLEKEYSNTKYYKELIKECANLRVYNKEKL